MELVSSQKYGFSTSPKSKLLALNLGWRKWAGQNRAGRTLRVEVYKKLAMSGRLKIVDPKLIRHGFNSGLFAVHKDATRDRLVLDGRPPNTLEPPQAKWIRTMANPVALGMLYLKPGHVLLSSGEDLRDYFYQFQVSAERAQRNALVEPLKPDEVLYVFEGRCQPTGATTWVGLDSLAMGDSLAREFAQGSHVGMLLQFGIAKTAQLLTLHEALPRGLFHVGVIVDDLVIIQQLLESELEELRNQGSQTAGGAAAALARKAYNEVHLEHNPKKGFQDQTLASYWGVDIDGGKGIMRCSNHRLWPAMMITMRIATLKLATVGLLSALAGTWVSLLGIRRRLFCLLDIIFEPMGLEDQSQVIRLSDALVDELLGLVMMGPLAMVNLRAEYSDFLVATDASLSGIAAVKTELTSTMTQELARHSLRKSTWSTLLPPGKSWQKEKGVLPPEDEMPDAEAYQVHPLWELCARGCKFRTTWSAKVVKPKHINILELDAHLREERRLCRSVQNLRYPSALDSQVVLGALVKGRASATSLTSGMRRNLGYPVGNDLYSFYMFFPSWMNRADGPSRDAAPDQPDLELPEWWPEALAGDFRRMDLWLEQFDEFQMQKIPFELLMGKQHVDLRSQSSLKKRPPTLQTSGAFYVGNDERAKGALSAGQDLSCVSGGPVQAERALSHADRLLRFSGGPVQAEGALSHADRLPRFSGGPVQAEGALHAGEGLPCFSGGPVQAEGALLAGGGLPRFSGGPEQAEGAPLAGSVLPSFSGGPVQAEGALSAGGRLHDCSADRKRAGMTRSQLEPQDYSKAGVRRSRLHYKRVKRLTPHLLLARATKQLRHLSLLNRHLLKIVHNLNCNAGWTY